MTVTLIIINYRNSQTTVHLCQSLARSERKSDVHVVVVDNASNEESLKTLKDVFNLGLNVDILAEKENHGYFGGARVGLDFARAKGQTDWVIVSNSDIDFSDPEFFTKLNLENAAGEIGVIAPSVRSGLSGRDQNPYMLGRPQAFRMHFYKWIFRYRLSCFCYQLLGLAKSLLKKRVRSQNAGGKRSVIYAAHGSFMIFTREYFKRGGDFAHRPFLFGEEITVAERCRKLGLQICYEPQLVVSHIEHASIGWMPSRRMLEFQREASTYCADTFF